MILLLIENRADINAINNDYNSALIAAIDSEFIPATELLIQKGADLNIMGQDGETALMKAARKGLIMNIAFYVCHLQRLVSQ